MKRSVRLLLVLALLVLSTLLATACAVTPPPNDGGETVTYTVALVLPEGVTVEGDNPLTVAEGEDASFVITLPERTIFRSAEGAGYDASTGTLTVPNVTADMRVILEVEEVDYDVDADVRYFFSGASTDTTSQPSNTSVKFGTQITVEARDEERQFVGWVFDNNSDRIVSTERTFTFRVTPDIAKKSAVGYRITLTPKYIDLGTFYYNANGGVVDSSTVCMQDTQYQDVTFIGTDSVRVKLSKTYLSYLSCATTFWNDGTFTREGYVLKEFNTAADGSGEAYSPGTKVYPFVEGSESFTLYCIWEPFEASDFTYETLTMPLPDVTATEDMPEGDARLATHWRTEGVIITGYTGADKATIALPDTLGGRPVIAIGAGVLTNLNVQTLVLPRHIQRIADGAVTGCDKLSTIYYPNSVYEVGDAWLDAASYTSFKTLVLTATMAPRYSNDEYGDFSLKLSRILSTMDRNRIIVISGSSSYQGLASAYMQDLFDGDYAVINFGTTRTSHCLLYLEAMHLCFW